MKVIQPVIKWSGSKRSQAQEILEYFPKDIKTYYEPFCGGCSVLAALLLSNKNVRHYVCSDLNGDLIALWNKIKQSPLEVLDWYRDLWQELNKDSDIDRKREYFNSIRDRLNKEHNPLDFMFVMRTTTNGMPRYNEAGEFNNSFHLTRRGVQPKELKIPLLEWSFLLKKHDVEFRHCSYEDIRPDKNDFMYLDPPYANSASMYFGSFDVFKFFDWLGTQECLYAFSFDGITTCGDNTFAVPENLYTEHIYTKGQNSSFRRIIGKTNTCMVQESLYIKTGD